MKVPQIKTRIWFQKYFRFQHILFCSSTSVTNPSFSIWNGFVFALSRKLPKTNICFKKIEIVLGCTEEQKKTEQNTESTHIFILSYMYLNLNQILLLNMISAQNRKKREFVIVAQKIKERREFAPLFFCWNFKTFTRLKVCFCLFQNLCGFRWFWEMT